MALQLAIDAMGGRRELAAALGVSVQAIQKWLSGRVPAERCTEIEALMEGTVTRMQLRPDLYRGMQLRPGLYKTRKAA